MKYCQRDIHGELIPETCLLQALCLIVDSSGMMGQYLPENVEAAINLFFRTLGTSKDADDLIEICVFESHDKVEYLGGFGKASSFTLEDLRYGGNWNLPEALAQALYVLNDHCEMLDRYGRAYTTPIIVVVSDNPVSAECSLFQPLDAAVATYNSSNHLFPQCLFVSTSQNNHFEHHLPNVEYRQADKGSLSPCMQRIAHEVMRDIFPQEIAEQPKLNSGLKRARIVNERS